MFLRNENTFPKKVFEKLQGFTRDYKNWEWGDLVYWMQDFKQLIEKNQFEELPVSLLLETLKTFSPCLVSSLMEGIQFKVLEVFSLLGQTSAIVQKKIIVMSLVPLFQVGSKDIREKIIETIEKICGNFVGFPIECIVSGIFKVIEEKGAVFDRASSMVIKSYNENNAGIYSSLWKVVLTSSQNKMPALVMLKSLKHIPECKNLMLNGILSGLNDANLRVKRASLDLIKINFPVFSNQIDKTDKILLLKNVLVIAVDKEPTILRRLWEWVYPFEMIDECESVEIISQTFLQIKTENPDRNLVVNIAGLICESEFGGKIFEKICFELIVYLIKWGNSVNESFSEIKPIITSFKSIVLEQVSENLESFLQLSENIGYSIISFVLSNELHNEKFSYIVFQQLLMSFEYLNDKLLFFDLLEKLSTSVLEIPSLYKLSYSISYYLTRIKEPSLLSKIVKILKNLEKNGLGIKQFLTDIKDKTKVGTGTEYFKLLDFLSNFQSPPISEREMQHIWKSLINNPQCFNMILNISTHNQDLVNEGLLKLIDKGKYGLPAFLRFWQRANPSEITKTINYNLLSIVINLLKTHDDIRPWIHSIDSKTFIVVDYYLEFLLDKITLRLPANKIYVYQNLFSKLSLISKLKTLKAFLSSITNIAINSLNHQETRNSTKESLKFHKISAETYMQALVKSLVLYILTQPFDELTLYAGDILELLVPNLDHNLRFHLVRGGIRCLEHAIAQQNSAVQVSIMNLISSSLLRLNEEDYMKLCNSRVFTACLLEGCFSREAIIRRQWRNTILKTLDFVCRYSTKDSFSHYFEPLLKGISHYLVSDKDVGLISTFQSIITCVFESGISHVLSFTVSNLETCIRISADFLLLAGQSYNERPPNETVRDIFTVISNYYPQDLIESFVYIWSNYCKMKPEYISLLLVVLHQFNLPLEQIFDHVLKFLLKDIKINKEIHIFISYLMYRLFNEALIISDFVLNYEKLWSSTLDLISELLKSPHQEVPALLLKTLSIAQVDYQKFKEFSTRTQKKKLKELTGRLFECIFSNIFSVRKQCTVCPYPDFVSECEIHELCLYYMRKHAYEVTDFACMKQPDARGLFISNCCLNLLMNLSVAKHGKKQATLFIVSVLQSKDVEVIEKLKKNVLELSFNDRFLAESFECFHEFLEILGSVLNNVIEKQEIIEKVLSAYPDGWIFNRNSPDVLKKRIIRLSLFIYSSEVDSFYNVVSVVENYLVSALTNPALFLHFCVLLKVTYLKLTYSKFKNIWNKIAVPLSIRLQEAFERLSDLKLCLSSIKLLEFFTLSEFEDFYNLFYIFVPDVPDIEIVPQSPSFSPVLLARFLTTSLFKPVYNSSAPSLTVKKRFTVKADEISSLQELEKIAVSFTQVCSCYSSQSSSPCSEIPETIEKELHSLLT